MEEEKIASIKSERKSNNIVTAIFIASVVVFSFVAGYFVRGATEPQYTRKIQEIVQLIESASVYYDDKTADEMANGLVKTLLGNDKYAAYYSPEEYTRVLAEDQGNYSGVGLAFKRAENGAYDGTVGKVYFNSSAYKLGVKEGDKLVAGVFKGQSDYVEFSSLVSDKKNLMQVVSGFFSQFDFGDEIKIKVLRGEEELTFALKKIEYQVSYVEYFDNEKRYYFSTEEDGFHGRAAIGGLNGISSDTAYIKLCAFEGGAAGQFKEALSFMKSRGKSKLILDLRDNGGGLTTALAGIASCLVNDNGANKIKIMYSMGEDGTVGYYTDGNNFDAFLTDISVIANCNTASASEALIGALNDYGDRTARNGAAFDLSRLILTGKHPTRQTYCTYGKGIMQTTYGLKTGGALVFTTAYIYWPLSEKCVQDAGITATDTENCVDDQNAISRADAVLH